jgi:hypothetical protein
MTQVIVKTSVHLTTQSTAAHNRCQDPSRKNEEESQVPSKLWPVLVISSAGYLSVGPVNL